MSDQERRANAHFLCTDHAILCRILFTTLTFSWYFFWFILVRLDRFPVTQPLLINVSFSTLRTDCFLIIQIVVLSVLENKLMARERENKDIWKKVWLNWAKFNRQSSIDQSDAFPDCATEAEENTTKNCKIIWYDKVLSFPLALDETIFSFTCTYLYRTYAWKLWIPALIYFPIILLKMEPYNMSIHRSNFTRYMSHIISSILHIFPL